MMPFQPGFVKTISRLEKIVELLVLSGIDDDGRGDLSSRPAEQYLQNKATAYVSQ